MPLCSERPIVRVAPGFVHDIETRNPENLAGLWSVFSKCSPALEDGKRYENMAWRLWSRETFCCAPDHTFPPRWSFDNRLSGTQLSQTDAELPELSTSVASDDSNPDSAPAPPTRLPSTRPSIHRFDSQNSQTRGKHVTSVDLEKVVSSIRDKRAIEPLSPLPEQLSRPLPVRPKQLPQDTTPRPASPRQVRYVPESSTSTVATALGSNATSPPVGSTASTSTDISSHSIVHGFTPGCISTSLRSSTNLNPTPILKTSGFSRPVPEPSRADLAKKKKPMFTLGASSDEDNLSSFEHSFMAKRSSLSDHLNRPAASSGKTTSFKKEVTMCTFHNATSEESEGAIESDSEDDTEDNAIMDDETDDEDWEDDDNSGPCSVNEKDMFQRVDSKPNLVSHRSLLTTLMHEGDRAQALQNAASRSTPAIRRSRTTSPNGPSTGNSPQEDSGLMMRQQVTRSKPIIMTTSNVHPPALSPRTTRRNMLQTELTQSLRQNLLWERQQKNSTTNAVNKRAQSAVSIPALRRAMTTNDIKGLTAFPQQAQALPKSPTFREPKNNSSYNDYFDQGLQEYHQKGW